MIIGLNGKAGAGKDVVAQHLVENYGFKRYAFADAVRDVALAINPILSTNWEVTADDVLSPRIRELRLSEIIDTRGWDWAKRNLPEVRRLLQVIGTEAGRMLLGENVWVEVLKNKLEADGWPTNVVITDFRFPNEEEFIRQYTGVTMKIVRENNPDAIAASHASEQYDPECDYTIHNFGTLENLYNTVNALMFSLTKAPR